MKHIILNNIHCQDVISVICLFLPPFTNIYNSTGFAEAHLFTFCDHAHGGQRENASATKVNSRAIVWENVCVSEVTHTSCCTWQLCSVVAGVLQPICVSTRPVCRCLKQDASVHCARVYVVLCVSWLHGELSAVVQLLFTAVGVSVGTAITLPRAAFPGTMYRLAFIRVHIYGEALPSDKMLLLCLWHHALLVSVPQD